MKESYSDEERAAIEQALGIQANLLRRIELLRAEWYAFVASELRPAELVYQQMLARHASYRNTIGELEQLAGITKGDPSHGSE